MKTVIDSPIGPIAIITDQDTLTHLHFAHPTELRATLNKSSKNSNPNLSAIHKKVITELKQYFKNPKTKFSVPFKLQGTDFQKRVWQALREIPHGQTLTYGELAQKLKTGPRAIGTACRTNPIPVIIPCHRIVSKQGLGGFHGKTAGKFLTIKTWLLQHEGAL